MEVSPIVHLPSIPIDSKGSSENPMRKCVCNNNNTALLTKDAHSLEDEAGTTNFTSALWGSPCSEWGVSSEPSKTEIIGLEVERSSLR